jgi:hypothetical protein
LIDYNSIRRRTPYIVRIPNSLAASSRNRRYYSDIVFCDHCGVRMVYAREFHAYYCNYCGDSVDPNSKHWEQQPQQKQSRQSEIEEAQSDETLDLDVKYSTTDGITDEEQHNNASTGARGSGSSGPRRGYTTACRFGRKHMTDFERVCAEEDRQMQERGWQITSDRIDMPQSHNMLDLAGGDKKRLLGSNKYARINKY